MATGYARQLLREAMRRFDNRRNGFGDIELATTAQLRTFLSAEIQDTHLPESWPKEEDGTPYEPQNADGSPKGVKYLDFP